MKPKKQQNTDKFQHIKIKKANNCKKKTTWGKHNVACTISMDRLQMKRKKTTWKKTREGCKRLRRREGKRGKRHLGLFPTSVTTNSFSPVQYKGQKDRDKQRREWSRGVPSSFPRLLDRMQNDEGCESMKKMPERNTPRGQRWLPSENRTEEEGERIFHSTHF